MVHRQGAAPWRANTVDGAAVYGVGRCGRQSHRLYVLRTGIQWSITVLHLFFVDFGTGYAPFLQGKVVDMFYFPLIVTTYPEWFPFWGGEPFIFFSPIFNFADACISVGVVAILLFCRDELTRINEL